MGNPVMHFELMGKDAIALQKFYAHVFGWKLGPPMTEFGNYSLVDREDQGIGGGIGEGDPRVTVYIAVDDLQAYLDKATKAGATVLMPVSKVTEDVILAMFADPAGNAIGLLQG